MRQRSTLLHNWVQQFGELNALTRARLRILLVTLANVGYRRRATDKNIWIGGSDRAWASVASRRDAHPWGLLHSFFGVGAIIVGILAGFNIAGPLWFQVIVFSGLSLISFRLFRQRLVQSTHRNAPDRVDSLIGETAVVTEEIPSRGIGKAEMRGTSWSAHNIGEQSLARGQRCRVERVQGLTIYVRAEQN